MTTTTQPSAHTPPARPVSGRRDPTQTKKASAAATSLPQVETQAAPVATSSDEPRMSRIATRAHELYVARGGVHGRDMEDWLQAEREIDGDIQT